MTYTDVVINVASQDYAVFRCFTVYTVAEVDYLRMVQYFVHREDVEMEYTSDTETPNIKSLRVWDNERVLLFDLQTDGDGVKNNDSAVATTLTGDDFDVTQTLVTPTTTISGIYSALYDWIFHVA